jgi:hypothetical protein
MTMIFLLDGAAEIAREYTLGPREYGIFSSSLELAVVESDGAGRHTLPMPVRIATKGDPRSGIHEEFV